MGDHHGDVVAGETVACEQVPASLEHFADGVLEDLRAVLVDEVQTLVHGLVGSWQAAAAGGHLEGVPARAVDFAQEIEEAEVFLAVPHRLDQHGAGAIAK